MVHTSSTNPPILDDPGLARNKHCIYHLHQIPLTLPEAISTTGLNLSSPSMSHSLSRMPRRKAYYSGDFRGWLGCYQRNYASTGMWCLAATLSPQNLKPMHNVSVVQELRRPSNVQLCHSGLKSPLGSPGYTWGKELGGFWHNTEDASSTAGKMASAAAIASRSFVVTPPLLQVGVRSSLKVLGKYGEGLFTRSGAQQGYRPCTSGVVPLHQVESEKQGIFYCWSCLLL